MEKIRILFHSVLNNLNVIGTLSFTNDFMLDELSGATPQKAGKITKDFMDALSDMISEVDKFLKNTSEIIELVNNEIPKTPELKKYLDDLSAIGKDMKTKQEDLLAKKTLLDGTDNASKCCSLKEEMKSLYEHIHTISGTFNKLRDYIRKIGKYPA